MPPVQHQWFLAAVQIVWNSFGVLKNKTNTYHLTTKLIVSDVSGHLTACSCFCLCDGQGQGYRLGL